MAKKICFTNQKGGVGKTASAQQLAYYLSRRGKRVLVVDMDPQWNLSIMFGFYCDEYDNDAPLSGRTVYSLFKGRPINEVIVNGDMGIDFILGSSLMAAAEQEFNGLDAFFLLKESLVPIEDKYDYIIIDTAPSLSTLTVNAYIACDGIVIPYKADSLTKAGVFQLLDQFNGVKKRFNPALRVYGVLMTMYDTRTNASKKAAASAEDVAKVLGTKVFETKIRAAAKMRELADEGKSIFETDPNSGVAKDYEAACAEILKEVK